MADYLSRKEADAYVAKCAKMTRDQLSANGEKAKQALVDAFVRVGKLNLENTDDKALVKTFSEGLDKLCILAVATIAKS